MKHLSTTTIAKPDDRMTNSAGCLPGSVQDVSREADCGTRECNVSTLGLRALRGSLRPIPDESTYLVGLKLLDRLDDIRPDRDDEEAALRASWLYQGIAPRLRILTASNSDTLSLRTV